MVQIILNRCIVPRIILDANFKKYLQNYKYLKFHFNILSNKFYSQKYSFEECSNAHKSTHEDDGLLRIVEYKSDSNIIYSTVLEKYKIHISYGMKKKIINNIIAEEKENKFNSSISLALQRVMNNSNSITSVIETESKCANDNLSENKQNFSKFPLGKFHDIGLTDCFKVGDKNEISFSETTSASGQTFLIKEDVAYRLKTFDSRSKQKLKKSTDLVELQEDLLLNNIISNGSENQDTFKRPIYGTPSPETEPSSVPCGGCGALLHCQDESLPGYLPSELFKDKSKGELRSSLCQRCFFLKTYNVAINVRISPEIYEKSLLPLTLDKALVIVVIDILDIPCSIWPGLLKLLGNRRPVFIVGNKVDLLPPDSTQHLINIQNSFISAIDKTCLAQTNIKHIAFISAKTGYGIEDLISKLQILWGTKGNIYIVGCTNAGKSTLFNALLGSDLCQNQASELIRRATASPWPGTTLNLLKFPLMKPTGERMTRRLRRLNEEKLRGSTSTPLHKSRFALNPTEATLTGYIGRTFDHNLIKDESSDPFILNLNRASFKHMGIKDQSYEYKQSKWLFDTPGTVQPDQFLGLLTHNELLQVLPRTMIQPQTFSLRIGQSLFLGGLARLDVLFIEDISVRLTVFSSSNLPVTIVKTVNASDVYRTYLGSDLLGVPEGNEARLERWPPLKPINISLDYQDSVTKSCADIVLSSAGFIAITGKGEIDLRGWTPGGRGIYVRDPPMLPSTIKLKGARIKGTPAFLKHNVYIPSAIVK